MIETPKHPKETTNNIQSTGNSNINIQGIGGNIGSSVNILNSSSEDIEETPPTAPKKKILFIAACANNLQDIDFPKEYRSLQEEMRAGKARDEYEWLSPILAATMREIMRSLHQNPNIIHFSGHSELGGIYIENEQGLGQLVTNELLEMLFSTHKDSIESIFLNSCYSAAQASLLSSFGAYVIGHNKAVGDRAAIAFAKGFYLALSEGADIPQAVQSGKIMAISEGGKIEVELWKDGKRIA